MSDDIIKQAELRHRRRPAGRVNEATGLFDDGELLSNNSTTLLSKNSTTLLSKTNDVSPKKKNKFFPEVIDNFLKEASSPTQFDCDLYRLDVHQSFTLPFIECKVGEVDAKALVSTCCKKSLISKAMFQTFRLSETPIETVYASVFLQAHRFDHNFEVREDIPDLVLGLDFLVTFEVMLNFRDHSLILDRFSAELPFMEKIDIPLKFRVHRNLAASF